MGNFEEASFIIAYVRATHKARTVEILTYWIPKFFERSPPEAQLATRILARACIALSDDFAAQSRSTTTQLVQAVRVPHPGYM